MNTFEKELSTKNLTTLLSCKEGVGMVTLDVEEEIDILCLNDESKSEHVVGPAKILIVID